MDKISNYFYLSENVPAYNQLQPQALQPSQNDPYRSPGLDCFQLGRDYG